MTTNDRMRKLDFIF